jgi:hypothetical protein
MSLKSEYDAEGDIPEEHKGLYSAGEDGKFRITPIEGLAPVSELRELRTKSAAAEAARTQEVNRRRELFGDMRHEDIAEKWQEAQDLLAGNSESKIKARIAERVEQATAQHKREAEQLRAQLSEYQAKDRRRSIHDAIRESLAGSGIQETAIADALLRAETAFDVSEGGAILTKQGAGLDAGMTPAEWAKKMRDVSPHWWPASQGAGARGGSERMGGSSGGGENPWSAEGWNRTRQAQMIRADREGAERAARQAGSRIGAIEPPSK